MDVEGEAVINARYLKEAREGVGSLQFFVAAMAAQLKDLQDKLAQIDVPIDQAETSAARLDGDAQQELVALRSRVQDLERQNSSLQQDLERQSVSFADHQSARQEISRLRAELEARPVPAADEPATEKDAPRKRWPLG